MRLSHGRWIGLFATALLLFFAAGSPRAQDAKDVDVKLVKYDGLTDIIKKLKGKIIIVDCWSLT